MIAIGATVRILPTFPDELVWHGKVGTLVEIDLHHADGDFYGVNFGDDYGHRVYFWREELEVIEQPAASAGKEE